MVPFSWLGGKLCQSMFTVRANRMAVLPGVLSTAGRPRGKGEGIPPQRLRCLRVTLVSRVTLPFDRETVSVRL